MKTRKWLLPVCIAGGVLLLLVIGVIVSLGIMSANGFGLSIGRFYSADIGAYLVSGDEAMLMSDQNEEKELFSKLSTGDLILVVHDGVDESYPAQTGAYRIFRLSKGDESDIPEDLNIGISTIGKFTVAEHSKGNASISLKIPDGWQYEVEDISESVEFSIAICPVGQTEGKLKVCYYTAFGVCGTGLEEVKIRLGGYEAYKGTYDKNRVWDFISLQNTPDSYVIINEGADAWWDEYGDEAMQILSTVVVGNGE